VFEAILQGVPAVRIRELVAVVQSCADDIVHVIVVEPVVTVDGQVAAGAT